MVTGQVTGHSMIGRVTTYNLTSHVCRRILSQILNLCATVYIVTVSFSLMYSIGTILPATESRNVEYKTGGGNYPLKVLPSV